MQPSPGLEVVLASLALGFARRLLALACTSSIDGMAGMEVAAPSSNAADREVPPEKRPSLIPVDVGARRPAKLRPSSLDRVHAMVAAVRSLPWAARSRELQALLGVSKTQFVRTADFAVRMGLLRRTGMKAGVAYHLGPKAEGRGGATRLRPGAKAPDARRIRRRAEPKRK